MKIANKKGFTMVELLIVLAIIAILAAVAIPVYSSQLENARKEVDNSNLRAATGLAAQDYILRYSGSTQSTVETYYAVLTYKNTGNTGAAVTSQNMMVYPVDSKVNNNGDIVDGSVSAVLNINNAGSTRAGGYTLNPATGFMINQKEVQIMSLQQNSGNARFIIKIGKGGTVLQSEIKSGEQNK